MSVKIRIDRHGGGLRIGVAVEPWVVELPRHDIPVRDEQGFPVSDEEALATHVRIKTNIVVDNKFLEIRRAAYKAIEKELEKS